MKMKRIDSLKSALNCSLALLLPVICGLVLSSCSMPTTTSNTSVSPTNSTPVASDPSSSELASPVQSNPAGVSGQGKISLARNMYFVFDGSGSMRHQPAGNPNKQPKIEGAKWAVQEFLKAVPKDVNLGLYVFDSKGARQVIPLGSNNRDQFLEGVDNVQAGGATPLGAAIRKAADALVSEYRKQLGYGEFRLIVITDGESTDSIEQGVSRAATNKIPIYTIGFDMGEQHSLRKHSVSYRSADSAKEVEKGLEEAGAELDVFDPPTFTAGTK